MNTLGGLLVGLALMPLLVAGLLVGGLVFLVLPLVPLVLFGLVVWALVSLIRFPTSSALPAAAGSHSLSG
ncbi:MAG: hypothetical protein VYE68_16805 [Acidobacteriota bacterium]|nr:hypothetical protein [Acidobacteriota bacterium]